MISYVCDCLSRHCLLLHRTLSDVARAEAEERVTQLRTEAEQLRSSLRKHKRHEKQLLEESASLQDKLETLTQDNLHLNQKLADKVCASFTNVRQVALLLFLFVVAAAVCLTVSEYAERNVRKVCDSTRFFFLVLCIF